jgi:hypothetical protein
MAKSQLAFSHPDDAINQDNQIRLLNKRGLALPDFGFDFGVENGDLLVIPQILLKGAISGIVLPQSHVLFL